jgi:hypothetical protein
MARRTPSPIIPAAGAIIVGRCLTSAALVSSVPADQWTQVNSPAAGGTVYANQGGDQIIYAGPRKRSGVDTKLLGTLVADVAYFFYGMSAYTGRNTSADQWRATIFLVLLVITGGVIRRWLRRRV